MHHFARRASPAFRARSRPRDRAPACRPCDQVLQERGDVLGVHLAGVIRNGGGQIERAEDARRRCASTVSPGRVSSQLPPRSAAISTITDPGAMRATISRVIRIGAFLPGHRGGGDHHVLLGQHAAQQLRAAGDRTPRPSPWRSRPCPRRRRLPRRARRSARPGFRSAPSPRRGCRSR